jgi:lipopolysaccharide transport protein LptA
MGRKARVAAALGVVSALAITGAWVRAEPLAVVDGEPVGVSADQLVVDLNKGTAVMTGNVRVQRGELLVRCDRVEARYDEAPHVTWAHASGNVVASWKGVQARAKEAELHLKRRVLELRGGVKMTRGGAWIEASGAAVDFGTGKVTLEKVSGSIPVPSAAVPSSVPVPSTQPGWTGRRPDGAP